MNHRPRRGVAKLASLALASLIILSLGCAGDRFSTGIHSPWPHFADRRSSRQQLSETMHLLSGGVSWRDVGVTLDLLADDRSGFRVVGEDLHHLFAPFDFSEVRETLYLLR